MLLLVVGKIKIHKQNDLNWNCRCNSGRIQSKIGNDTKVPIRWFLNMNPKATDYWKKHV